MIGVIWKGENVPKQRHLYQKSVSINLHKSTQENKYVANFSSFFKASSWHKASEDNL